MRRCCSFRHFLLGPALLCLLGAAPAARQAVARGGFPIPASHEGTHEGTASIVFRLSTDLKGKNEFVYAAEDHIHAADHRRGPSAAGEALYPAVVVQLTKADRLEMSGAALTLRGQADMNGEAVRIEVEAQDGGRGQGKDRFSIRVLSAAGDHLYEREALLKTGDIAIAGGVQ